MLSCLVEKICLMSFDLSSGVTSSSEDRTCTPPVVQALLITLVEDAVSFWYIFQFYIQEE